MECFPTSRAYSFVRMLLVEPKVGLADSLLTLPVYTAVCSYPCLSLRIADQMTRWEQTGSGFLDSSIDRLRAFLSSELVGLRWLEARMTRLGSL
jgi:hypothetical protein